MAVESFEIRVNGVPFQLWETAQIDRSIDTNCGAFMFTSTGRAGPYPVKEGDEVQVSVGGVQRITGFVDRYEEILDAGKHQVSITGRDNIQDLIDSSIPDSAKAISGPTSLKTLCEKVIASLGASISVIDQTSGIADFTADDFFNAGSGGNAIDFLTNFARKRRVYINSDGRGSLVLFRPGRVDAAIALTNVLDNARNNVISARKINDLSMRFGRYAVRSQSNFGSSPNADYAGSGTDMLGTVTDSAVRSSRYLEVQSEESLSDGTETDTRVQEEANLRRARSSAYECTVVGVSQTADRLWELGELVKVKDDFLNISGRFFVRSISHFLSVDEGAVTRLVLSPPDAYAGQGAASRDTKRRGSLETVSSPTRNSVTGTRFGRAV